MSAYTPNYRLDMMGEPCPYPAVATLEAMPNLTALLAAKAGATFVSPFVGRHDDNGFDGMDLIRDIRLIYDNYAFDTEILVASVRHPIHVLDSAKIGADVMTAPPAVIKGLSQHVLTDKGLEQFSKDWAATGQSIL